MANDHYVPRFYLKNFQAVTGKLWCYEHGVRPSLMGVKSVACIEEYYSIKAKHLENDKRHIDKFITQLESFAAPIYKKLVEGGVTALTVREKGELSVFFGHLASRTPLFRERAKNFHLALHTNLAKASEVDSDFKLKFTEDSDDFFLKEELIIADKLTPVLWKKHWHIVESSTSRVFVTSDNPITLLIPELGFPPELLGFELAMVALPLTPKRCLMMSNRPGKAPLIKVGREAVNEVNQNVIANAHKQVFSNLFSKEFQKALDKIKPGESILVGYG